MPDKPDVIGERLWALRVALGFEKNQQGFASHVGISPPALANYEKGDRRPNIEQLMKITSTTGATFEYLLEGNERYMPAELLAGVRKALTKGRKAR